MTLKRTKTSPTLKTASGKNKTASSQSKAANSKSGTSASNQSGRIGGKNISKTIKNGTIVHTRDEYFNSGKNFKKQGYEKKGNYRKAVVVDSNRKDELALVKLTSSKPNNKLVKDIPFYETSESKFKAFIEVEDRNGKPIKISGRFIPNNQGKHYSEKAANAIKKDCVKNENRRTRFFNRLQLRLFKGRKKRT